MLSDPIVSIINEIFSQDHPDVQLIYSLFKLGFNFDHQLCNEGTLLHFFLMKHPQAYNIYHALFQCGADMMHLNKVGESAYSRVLIDPQSVYSETLKSIFKKYYPSLWKAVLNDDILAVRKSLNLWCRIDIVKNGESLKDLSIKRGVPEIIQLISSMDHSIQFAHACMGCDIDEARRLLDSFSHGINVNIRNLGAYCATPLCYAIQQNSAELIDLLLQHGAALDALLVLDDEVELPIVFLALRRHVPNHILKLIMKASSQTKILEAVKFQSNSPLHFAIDEGLNEECIRTILRYSSAKLLAMRNQYNLTAYDMCKKASTKRIFEEHVMSKIDDQQFLLDLVANGYPHIFDSLKRCNPQPQSLVMLDCLEKHIISFRNAICNDNLQEVQSLLIFSHTEISICVANCRVRGDAQPPLHKAVLHASPEVVHLLCSVIVGTLNTKVDNIRDPMGRTALCYSYLVEEHDKMTSILIEFGASEFTVDKDNRSPTGFREQRHSPLIANFLEFHRSRVADRTGLDEPSLWPQDLYSGMRHKIHAASCAGACYEEKLKGDSPDDLSDKEVSSTSSEDESCILL